ncbi:MAG: phosphatidate cytidylyltransferase [Proteiniphilum sp.]|jgi:phosphatidate cytidylyltransferase|nr:phosphatidate cytidylyltransferase [Proteiniphilum sp.]
MSIKDISVRAGAGIVYILVILSGLLGGRFSFLAIFGAILGFGLFEFYRMVEKDTFHAISKIFNILLGIIIFVSVYFHLEGTRTTLLPAAILAYLLILVASAVFLHRDDVFHGIIYSVFGQIYITMPLSLLMFISYSLQPDIAGDGGGASAPAVLALFVFLWINDTAAYFIGSLVGRHKLMEHISPKKSVEGFIAGILFTVLGALIFARLYPGFSVAFWAGFAVVASLSGTLGDLFESLIKRTCKVKDTGHLIPGHGGILDRIDSLLVAVPAVFLYLILFLSF